VVASERTLRVAAFADRLPATRAAAVDGELDPRLVPRTSGRPVATRPDGSRRNRSRPHRSRRPPRVRIRRERDQPAGVRAPSGIKKRCISGISSAHRGCHWSAHWGECVLPSHPRAPAKRRRGGTVGVCQGRCRVRRSEWRLRRRWATRHRTESSGKPVGLEAPVGEVFLEDGYGLLPVAAAKQS
jgi:hypothetical protein